MHSPAFFSRSRSLPNLVFLALAGALAGFINGLLGTGGGIILVLLLARVSDKRQHGFIRFPLQRPDIYANALAVMLPISVFSTTRYVAAGVLDVAAFSPLLLPSVAGGIVGGILLDRLSPSRLKTLFAVLLLVSGILLIVWR